MIAAQLSLEDQLAELKRLHELGLMSDNEFSDAKAKAVSQWMTSSSEQRKNIQIIYSIYHMFNVLLLFNRSKLGKSNSNGQSFSFNTNFFQF